jgi:hypothetical protein
MCRIAFHETHITILINFDYMCEIWASHSAVAEDPWDCVTQFVYPDVSNKHTAFLCKSWGDQEELDPRNLIWIDAECCEVKILFC